MQSGLLPRYAIMNTHNTSPDIVENFPVSDRAFSLEIGASVLGLSRGVPSGMDQSPIREQTTDLRLRSNFQPTHTRYMAEIYTKKLILLEKLRGF